VQQKLGDWIGSTRTFDQLLAEPRVNPKWQPFAYYYVGVAMERQGQMERAAEAYWRASGEAQTDAAIRFRALLPHHRRASAF
jgi:hypothetical protein